MSFVAALLPVVIYILVVYKIDNFSLVSVRGLILQIIFGMLAALVCFFLFQQTGKILTESQSVFFDPIMEEAIKAVPIVMLACRKQIVFFIDSVICGAAVGGGFSIVENIFYLLLGDDLGMGTVLFRGLEVALIHMGCSAIVAACCMLMVRLVGRAISRQKLDVKDVIMTAFLLLIAPTIHVCHNIFHFNPLIQFIFVITILGALLVLTFMYDVDMIHRWLDTGLDQQIGLLDSIKEGHLDDTPTGVFLESVKESFPPEVYFDIICYVQLNIELAVAAKSRVMIRESGIDFPLEDSQKELILSQYTEYKLLEKSLGKTARMTIAPVVKLLPADLKSLNDLVDECKS